MALDSNIFIKAIRYALATTKHALDGFEKASPPIFQQRIRQCILCEYLKMNGDSPECGVCGCPIAKKALWLSEDCPHPSGSRWVKQEPLPPFTQGSSGSGGCGCNKS